jgi:myosin heavy subunit
MCVGFCQKLPPHVYELANNAYKNMSMNKKDQSVVIRCVLAARC